MNAFLFSMKREENVLLMMLLSSNVLRNLSIRLDLNSDVDLSLIYSKALGF